MSYPIGPLKVTFAGESHGAGYTGIIEGLPSGLEITIDEIQRELDRRKPGQKFATSRQEADKIEITAGYFQGKTTGAPLAFFIANNDQRSKDYDLLQTHFRPGHADAVREIKYPHHDHRGSGHHSARFTMVTVVAGAFAKKILSFYGIKIQGYVSQIGPIKDLNSYDSIDSSRVELSPLRMINPTIDQEAQKFLTSVIEQKTSVASSATFQADGLPLGLGSPHADKLNARISFALFSLPAVQGIHFGAISSMSDQFGHNFHDIITQCHPKKIQFASNHHGGILGGMSTGAPLVVHCQLKPPSSFGHPQYYWNKKLQKNDLLELSGRFDPVLAPRFVPIGEAQMAIEILNMMAKSCC